jgi:hypothetical protein
MDSEYTGKHGKTRVYGCTGSTKGTPRQQACCPGRSTIGGPCQHASGVGRLLGATMASWAGVVVPVPSCGIGT